jgi:F0F1-type ATP synthase assembly protein I
MKATVLQTTNVLKQNDEHKNFTATNEVITQGTVITGQPLIVEGLRRGEPFKYRLFVTKEGKIIYQNKIKPMAVTEVTLGADAQKSATVVDTIPTKKNLTVYTIGGALIGGGLGYYLSKRMANMTKQKMMIFTGIGVVAGFLVGKKMESGKIKIFKRK